MKISRHHLRNIINEEIGRVVETPAAAAPIAVAGGTAIAAGGVTLGNLAWAGWYALLNTPAALFALGFAAIAGVIGGAIWWIKKSIDEKERIATEVESQRLGASLLVYNALKGLRTDEKGVRGIMMAYKDDLHRLYDEYNMVLEVVDDTGSGDLIEWLEDDGMRKEAAIVRFVIMGEI